MAGLRVLLDTHVLLWLVSAPHKIGAHALEVLADPRTELLVSAASAWEIAIRTRLGRLDGDPLLSAWGDVVRDMAARDLAIDAEDAIFAGRLNWDHNDPFDRVLVAQAARRSLTIVTNDRAILRAALTPTITA
ncbi:type II toxin-antitoxin system VapC family toxin [Mycobacterium sp. Z3061]|uniref:type II toxin-antitoxin system VapC family toxin n=1 Tax=Mycobacterium sp. Z3061 TaxID=3073562 RepID=UPI0028731177|nr:type II toxin-antitoxin system VapC family toxin [Mycobacterium sp. Z3061]